MEYFLLFKYFALVVVGYFALVVLFAVIVAPFVTKKYNKGVDAINKANTIIGFIERHTDKYDQNDINKISDAAQNIDDKLKKFGPKVSVPDMFWFIFRYNVEDNDYIFIHNYHRTILGLPLLYRGKE